MQKSLTVVIPYGYPGKVLVAKEKIEVGTVGGVALPVVVEGVDLALRLGDAIYLSPISVVAVLILVQVVSEVDDVVNGVLYAMCKLWAVALRGSP